MDPAAAFLFAADGATAASGAFNTVWLLAFAVEDSPGRGEASPARRTAAVALAGLNAGVAVQAAFAQAMFSARRLGFSIDPFFEPGAWLASRLLLLAGTLLISMLILRRLSR